MSFWLQRTRYLKTPIVLNQSVQQYWWAKRRISANAVTYCVKKKQLHVSTVIKYENQSPTINRIVLQKDASWRWRLQRTNSCLSPHISFSGRSMRQSLLHSWGDTPNYQYWCTRTEMQLCFLSDKKKQLWCRDLTPSGTRSPNSSTSITSHLSFVEPCHLPLTVLVTTASSRPWDVGTADWSRIVQVHCGPVVICMAANKDGRGYRPLIPTCRDLQY